MDARRPDETAELRMREQLAGSTAVGVSQVDFLEYPDGILTYSSELRLRAHDFHAPPPIAAAAMQLADAQLPGAQLADAQLAGVPNP